MRGLLAGFKQGRGGFTIVELVIVVVVIAILAAVVVVGYKGVTLNAVKVGMKSDLDTASSVIAGARKQGIVGNYPDSKDEAGIKASDGNDIQYTTADGSSYCITVTSVNAPGVAYYYSSESNAIKEGICPGHDNGNPGPWARVETGASTYGLTNDGSLYAWGDNSYGTLGDGTYTDRSVPTKVKSDGVLAGKVITDISSASYYDSRSVCVVADARVYCWGDNSFTSTGYRYTEPVAARYDGDIAGKDIEEVYVGSYSVCAKDSQSMVYCWSKQDAPRLVSNTGSMSGRAVSQVSYSRSWLCILASDSTVHCMTVSSSSVFSSEPGFTPAGGAALDGISSGSWGGICTTTTNRDVYCWRDSFTQAINGVCTDYLNSSVPSQVCPSERLSGKVSKVSVGYMGACGLTEGSIYCWGNTQLNNVKFTVSRPFSSMSARGTYYMCGIANGNIYCAGYNNKGQLGNGSTVDSYSSAVKIVSPEGL